MSQECPLCDLGLPRKKSVFVGVDFGSGERAALALIDYSDIEARLVAFGTWDPPQTPWQLKPTTGRRSNTWLNGPRTSTVGRGKSWYPYMNLFADKLKPKGPLDDLTEAVQWGLRTGEIKP